MTKRTKLVSPKGHRLGRRQQVSAFGGTMANCECGTGHLSWNNSTAELQSQHDAHLKQLGLDKVEKAT